MRNAQCTDKNADAWPWRRMRGSSSLATQWTMVFAGVLLLLNGCSSSQPPRADQQGDAPTDGEQPPSGSSSDGGRKPSSAGRSPSSTTGTTGTKPDDQKPGATATPNTAIVTEPIAIDDCGDNNAAGVSAADAKKLKAGGGSPAGMKWLYPYDGTVFPRGMIAPDLMWDGPAADVAYVHIKSQIFEYWGCLKPTAAGRIALDQKVWEEAGKRSAGKQDIYTVELSVLSLGKVTGPATSHFQIAQAAIKGSIYYNTYSTKLLSAGGAAAPGGVGGLGGFGGFPGGGGGFPGGGGGSGGVVVRIPAGGKAEVFGQMDCNGCHSVSADGSRLLAQSATGSTYSYALVGNGPAPMPTMPGAVGPWTALYPDGSAILRMSTAVDVARTQIFGGLSGNTSTDATLYDAKTGQILASKGIPPGALMPAFSPDGTHLAFNDFAIDEAHGIALVQYDTKTHTASEYTVLHKEAAGAVRPGWPFFLPDNHGVVFVRTSDGGFTGGGVGVSGGILPGGAGGAPLSELWLIDVESKKLVFLAKAMGFNTPDDAGKGTTYLPFGADDVHHSYYPTVSPVASGGYFWVFFDSIRNYGNLGLQRQLWGAALDISPDGTYTADPSHPPFYLSGQEAGTGNHRAFAALDPCHKDGDVCTTGIDCCGGFCYDDSPGGEFAETGGHCSPMKVMCSKRDERCQVDADCCPPAGDDAPNSCIAGFCAYVPLI
jgi:hypothetical protein